MKKSSFSHFPIFSRRLVAKMKRAMWLKGKKSRQIKNKNKKMPPHAAMEDCIFPEEIMVCILSRLPVKSIVRFKSVCKPWLQLLSTPGFKKLHQGQFLSGPQTHSFITHKAGDRNTSPLFFKIGEHQKPVMLDSPLSHHHNPHIDFLGCCKGLVCLSAPPYVIHLWNPALRLSKRISPPQGCRRPGEWVSLGFGYDSVGDDFKLVRLLCVEGQIFGVAGKYVQEVQVYSANSDSWINVDQRFIVAVSGTKNLLIVGGNPYWLGNVFLPDRGLIVKVLVCFDMTTLEFRFEYLWAPQNGRYRLIDCDGSVGALTFSINNLVYDAELLDVWALDVDRAWRKKHSFGPVFRLNVKTFWEMTKDGKVIGEHTNGQLFLFDPDTRFVTRLMSYGGHNDLHPYTEDLTHLQGMEPARRRCPSCHSHLASA